MKLMGICSAIIALLLVACVPAFADMDSASVRIDALPDSGTYFITSASSDQALQPPMSSLGQSVLLYDFNKSGTQKWTITRRIDLKTNMPTNRYTIRLAGENSELHFQPHPLADSGAILGMDQSVFVLEPGDAGTLVKSVEKNGDAMYVLAQPPMSSEVRFGANDGSKKFRWNFIPASAAAVKIDPLPNTGTYFITSVSSDEALQPAMSSLGQAVLLSNFNKSGTQKWAITRRMDLKTNMPTNRYTIRLAGENSELHFQPHPLADSGAILGTEQSVFVLEPADAGILVKSVEKNGDAMHVYAESPSFSEVRFAANDGSKKFLWNFLSTD